MNGEISRLYVPSIPRFALVRTENKNETEGLGAGPLHRGNKPVETRWRQRKEGGNCLSLWVDHAED